MSGLTPNMLRTLHEIDEGRVQFAYHHRATIHALMARNMVLPPVACGGKHSGALTEIGRRALHAAASSPSQ